ncbi:MAG: ATP-binding protein [Bacillota bacterium]
MKEPKRVGAALILSLVFALLCSHVPVLYTLFYHDLSGAPTAKAASLDAAGACVQERVILDGEWAFYWNRLIITESEPNDEPDFLIEVPGYWSEHQIDGTYLPAYGCASYRLTLKGLYSSRPVTVYLPDFGSAYRVFIDGRLASQSGTVSKQPSAVFTTAEAKLYPVLLPEAPEHTVVIETATTRFSGLYMAPVLQAYDSAEQAAGNLNAARLILFGMALFSFFALVVAYTLTFRKGLHSFWLLAMGLLVLLRVMLTAGFYSMWQRTVFCGLSYEAANPLMFLVSFGLKYLLIYLVEVLLGIAFSRKEKFFFLLYYAALYLAYLFIPQGVYNRYLTILLPAASFVIELYIFFKVWINRYRLKKYGMLIYWGASLAVIGLIVDSYYINGNIYLNLSPALLTLFSVYMMLLCLVSALRTVHVHRELGLSASQLALARSQIAMQTDYYDALSAKINEARSARHDMRHFVGAMQRLLSEGRYADLDRFLSEYADNSETEPLPVFCENAVANSILGYYSLKTKERGIPFCCSCAIPRRLSIGDSDLCVVLGNALENALEACERVAPSDARFLSAEARISGGQLLIKIENACNGSLRQEDGRYISAKTGLEHGMGLLNIQKVMNAYGGFLKAEDDGTKFTLMAAFPVSIDPFFR